MIVLDYKMPLADGLQAASEICRNLPKTPIELETGLALIAIETELVARKYQKKPDQAWTSNSSPNWLIN